MLRAEGPCHSAGLSAEGFQKLPALEKRALPASSARPAYSGLPHQTAEPALPALFPGPRACSLRPQAPLPRPPGPWPPPSTSFFISDSYNCSLNGHMDRSAAVTVKAPVILGQKWFECLFQPSSLSDNGRSAASQAAAGLSGSGEALHGAWLPEDTPGAGQACRLHSQNLLDTPHQGNQSP